MNGKCFILRVDLYISALRIAYGVTK